MDAIQIEMGGKRWTFEASASGCRLAGRTLIDAADEMPSLEGRPAAVRVEVPARLAEAVEELVGLRAQSLAQG